jgi:hypothetical protein
MTVCPAMPVPTALLVPPGFRLGVAVAAEGGEPVGGAAVDGVTGEIVRVAAG